MPLIDHGVVSEPAAKPLKTIAKGSKYTILAVKEFNQTKHMTMDDNEAANESAAEHNSPRRGRPGGPKTRYDTPNERIAR